MPRLILHAGTNKTGTTQIQHFCKEHDRLLQSHGIVYPRAGRKYGLNHHPFALAMGGKSSEYFGNDQSFTSLLDELAEESRGARTVLISSEMLFRINPDPTSNLDALRKRFDPIEFIIYIRRQDSFLVSAWGSAIRFRMNAQMPPFEKYCRTVNADFLEDVERWDRLLGRPHLRVRPFVRLAWHKQSLLDDFFSLVDPGLELPAVDFEKGRNASWPVQSLELIRRLNTLDIVNRDSLVDRIREISRDFPVPENTGLLTHDLQAEILARYRASNRRLAERYWTPDERRLFEEQEVSSHEESYAGPSGEEYARIIAEVWRSAPAEGRRNRFFKRPAK